MQFWVVAMWFLISSSQKQQTFKSCDILVRQSDSTALRHKTVRHIKQFFNVKYSNKSVMESEPSMSPWCYWMQMYLVVCKMRNFFLSHLISRLRHSWQKQIPVKQGVHFTYFALIPCFWRSSCSRDIKNTSQRRPPASSKSHSPAVCCIMKECVSSSSSSAPRLTAHSSFTVADTHKHTHTTALQHNFHLKASNRTLKPHIKRTQPSQHHFGILSKQNSALCAHLK